MGYLSPMLAVRDMKKTIYFYMESLGFQLGMLFPGPDKPEYANLSKDGMALMFIPAANLGIGKDEKPGKGVNLYLQIDGDIDAYYDEIKRRGVKIATEIKDEPFGIRDFTVEDIDGYQLTFNQTIGAPGSCPACEVPIATNCESCGMPMASPGDFGGGNPENKYCVHCTHADGSLKSYDEALEGMASFLIESQKMDREAAESIARDFMARMPAWGDNAQN